MKFEMKSAVGALLVTMASGSSVFASGRAQAADLAVGATPLDEGQPLGDLEYKRMQDTINKGIPDQVKRFHQMCGYDVNVVVDWASLGRGKDTLSDFSSNYGVERLVTAFQSVCKDQAGKDAAKAKIHTLKATNTKDPKAVKITVGGGAMTALLNWTSGGAPGMNESQIGAEITKQL